MKLLEVRDQLCMSDLSKMDEVIVSMCIPDYQKITVLKNKYPRALVLANLKITNRDYINAKFAFDAGADIVSVMGFSDDDTILKVVKIAQENQGKVLVDFTGIDCVKNKSIDMDLFGVDYILLEDEFISLDILEDVHVEICKYKTSVEHYMNQMIYENENCI